MYLVSGSNLFGQWDFRENIVERFTSVTFNEISNQNSSNKEQSKPELIDITWSYNIVRDCGNFYVTGAFGGEENSTIKLDLPSDCKELNNREYLHLIGNDNYLLLINGYYSEFWKLNFSDSLLCSWIKLPNFISTESCLNSKTPKKNVDCSIVKAVTKYMTCVCLTELGTVYEIPRRVEVNNCTGTIIDIDCGYEHTIALTNKGRVYTWGNGRRCQLGHGDLTCIDEPAEVEALAGINIIKVKAGGWHCLALSESGDLYTWGWNDAGQLGISEKDNSSIQSYALPTVVDFYDETGRDVELNVKDIACGTRHSAVLTSGNTIWTSGSNKFGQLGLCSVLTPFLKAYKEVFVCEQECTLLCGPWTTVVKVLNE